VKQAKPVTQETFKSIMEPVADRERVISIRDELSFKYRTLADKYLPFLSTFALNLGPKWEPTWKSIPTRYGKMVSQYWAPYATTKWKADMKLANGVFHGFLYEWWSYLLFQEGNPLLGHGFTSAPLFDRVVRFPYDPLNDWWTDISVEFFYKRYLPPIKQMVDEELSHHPFRKAVFGRLARSVDEGGGKRRMFFIGNYVKQRILKPVHDWAAAVLKRLVNDGTFDQAAPLRWVKGYRDVYSYDLSSATDRWPLAIIDMIVEGSFGPQLSTSVMATLGWNMAEVDWVEHQGRKKYRVNPGPIAFLAGQPLGLYASWPLFALSHHFVVWLAAERVYGPSAPPFSRYAILGDDVVIADRLVAEQYARILGDLQVKISLQKSIISSSGAFEFAKRFFVKKGRVDCSPVSIKMLSMTRSLFGLIMVADKYSVGNLATLCRLHGGGYRVSGSIHSTKARKWSRLRAAARKPTGRDPLQFEWWVASGLLPNPYTLGLVADRVRQKLLPREHFRRSMSCRRITSGILSRLFTPNG